MPIQVKGLSKQFRLFKREAGLYGAFRSFFNRKYENFHALQDISIQVQDGEIVGILGENGAGKSTVMNLICGLIKPDFGSININGVNATNYPIYLRMNRFRISMCPQFGGFFHFTFFA